VVLGWVAQYPLVVLGKMPTPSYFLPLPEGGGGLRWGRDILFF